jgi:hypothetical protein
MIALIRCRTSSVPSVKASLIAVSKAARFPLFVASCLNLSHTEVTNPFGMQFGEPFDFPVEAGNASARPQQLDGVIPAFGFDRSELFKDPKEHGPLSGLARRFADVERRARSQRDEVDALAGPGAAGALSLASSVGSSVSRPDSMMSFCPVTFSRPRFCLARSALEQT